MPGSHNRLTYLRGFTLLSSALISCAPHAMPRAARTPHNATRVETAVPEMPVGTLAASLFDPGSLHAIPQKPLVTAPDAWDPTGTFVGHGATCEVWETSQV